MLQRFHAAGPPPARGRLPTTLGEFALPTALRSRRRGAVERRPPHERGGAHAALRKVAAVWLELAQVGVVVVQEAHGAAVEVVARVELDDDGDADDDDDNDADKPKRERS